MLAVIVLDCAEPTILKRQMAAGRMPALAQWLAQGTTVDLQSDAMFLDGTTFQTLLTGVNPGRHGVYKYRQLVPGTYRYRMSKTKRSPVPQFWSVLSERGRRGCIFDVPKSFPFRGFRGKLVASWGAHSPAAAPASTPSGLRRQLRRRFGEHPQRMHEPVPLSPEGYRRSCNHLIKATATRAEVCRWLLGDASWDYFMTTFSESHTAGHQFWHLRDSAHPAFDPAAAVAYSAGVETIYTAIDAAIARLIESLPSRATIVVLTQQGMDNNYTASQSLPAWLARRDQSTAEKPVNRRGNLRTALSTLVPSTLHHMLNKHTPKPLVDWWVKSKYTPSSRVYMLPGSEYSAMLRVNLRGREPAGTVPADDYSSTLASLRSDLLRLRNSANGKPAVRDVIFTHERYQGPCLDHLPDAIVQWHNDTPIPALDCPRYGQFSGGLNFGAMTQSLHTAIGLAVISGPAVPCGRISAVHSLEDMNATLYALLNEPVPAHVEGRAFDFGSVERSDISTGQISFASPELGPGQPR